MDDNVSEIDSALQYLGQPALTNEDREALASVTTAAAHQGHQDTLHLYDLERFEIDISELISFVVVVSKVKELVLALDVPNCPIAGFSPFLHDVAIFLFSGICHVALANNQRRHRLGIVEKNRFKLKRFVRLSGGRYIAHIHILEADIAGIRGETVTAPSKFPLFPANLRKCLEENQGLPKTLVLAFGERTVG